MSCAIWRFAPEIPFPPYAYVRGRHPHPTRSPAGHSYGKPVALRTRLEPERWEVCQPYLYGIDLYNYGYYWEAHEVWEGLWHGCGRSGMTADLLKGLIALTAAGVKLREGSERGLRQHAGRAQALFDRVAQALGPRDVHYLGVDPGVLSQAAAAIARDPVTLMAGPNDALPFVLRPEQYCPPA
ncbi:MAG: DUF309 domain-containing protein [Gammaproteobacteria bacterium]